jgi:hypothetical protein
MMGRSPVPLPGPHPPENPPSPFFPSGSHSPPARVSQPLGSKLPNLLPKGLPGRKLAATAKNPVVAAPKRFFPDSVPPPPEPEAAPPPASPYAVSRSLGGSGALAPAANLSSAEVTMRDLDPHSEATETETQAVLPSPLPVPLRTRVERTGGAEDEAHPSPDAVLRTLAQVGLYETKGGVVPAWEAPVPPAPRRVWVMAAAVVVAAGAGLGGYRYATALQSERLAQAQAISAHLATELDSGSSRALTASEAEFQRLFELDSRGQDAALLWLKNRALHTLIADEPAPGIESALERARAVGVDEPRLVFGRIASALSTGDLPGAAQLVTLWDPRAKADAMYQLFVGAMFERAGNAQALERFQSAATLQPDLKLAHLMAARLAVLQLGPEKAKPTLDLACARLGPGPAEQVLRGLAWASAPSGTGAAPELPSSDALAELPPSVRSTASAVEAVRAHREGHPEQAEAAFQRALGPATEPVLAAWIGYQALDAGDVQIARTAALKAMELSALHEDSQALAARIALADGRLREAQDVARRLDPKSPDALLIEVVSAYENLQSADMARLLGSLPSDPSSSSTLQALHDSGKVMLGQLRNKGDLVKQLGSDAQVWGPLVALDLALDSGQLEVAEQLLQAHEKSADQPSFAARAVRLRRYQGQAEAALERVRPMLDVKTITPRAAAEAVLAFIDAGRAAAAAGSLNQVSDSAGALAPWLAALVESAQGRAKLAVKELAHLPLPAKSEPLLVQTVALRSLSAAKDRRAKTYQSELGRRFPNHPEIKLAAH